MNNEKDNSNIFFSKPSDNLSKPDLMAPMQEQNTQPNSENQTLNVSSNTNVNPINQPLSSSNITNVENNPTSELNNINQNTQPNSENQTLNVSSNTNVNPINQPESTSNITNIENNPTSELNNINQNTQPNSVSQPTNLIAEPTRLNQTFINDNDEELLNAYIGKNNEKIKSRNYNFSALFFSMIYLFYRKMVLFGILLFIVSILISLFITPIFPFIINIVLCFTFNKLYLKNANKKINKIKSNNPSATKEMLIALCAEKGGVSIIRIILGLFAVIFIATIIIMISVMMGAVTIFGNLFKDFADKTTSSLNGEYNGVLIHDTTINMVDNFSLTPVEPFQNESNTSNYNYKFTNNESSGVFKDCEFSLIAVQGFSDGAVLIKQMAEYNDATDNIFTKNINNINWTGFSTIDNIGTTYYYGTTKDNKAYLFKYDIEKNASLECASYQQTILNSIMKK